MIYIQNAKYLSMVPLLAINSNNDSLIQQQYTEDFM